MFREFRILAIVPATDIDRARAWYEEKLGLVPTDEPIGRLYYEAPDGSSLLIVPTAFPGAKSTAAGWDVTDIDGVISELRARGVTFIDYDLPGYKTPTASWSIVDTRWRGSGTARATHSESTNTSASESPMRERPNGRPCWGCGHRHHRSHRQRQEHSSQGARSAAGAQ